MLSNRRSTMMAPAMARPQSYQPGTTTALPTMGSLNPESEPHCTSPSVLTSTTDQLPGYRTVRVAGTVYGMTTYAHKDTKSLLKSLRSSSAEVKSMTHMMYNARDQAVQRMTTDCVARGANAIVGIRFEESEILGIARVSVYGTAVYVERDNGLAAAATPENPFAGS
ncbi:putative heavy-metal-binding-domain-containing protein [Xylariomycetidae sp. FL2044]|nr:putative heavy-metal-binding-domain-containing protein [Xylariomycetidae sp. FL2044]